jgi:4'-phosphopantetheinyl transferase
MDVYWLEQTTADLPAHDDWLSAAEAARSRAMRFAKRRADWRLGRWTAKNAVAAHLHLQSLASIEILAAPSGAPEVFVAGEPAPVSISLSHRGGRAVCAVAAAGVLLGCDLEIVEPRSEAFAIDYFTGEEQTLVARVPVFDRPRILALLWSGKESVLKALRTGLRLDTRSVSVDPIGALLPAAEETWHPLHGHYAGQDFPGWWQQTGDLMRTMVAVPAPAPPQYVRLRLAENSVSISGTLVL